MTIPATVDTSDQALGVLLDDTDLNRARLVDTAAQVRGADFADLYLEQTAAESWRLDEERIDSGEFSISRGMSLRAVYGEASVFACADLISDATLQRVRTAVSEGQRHLASSNVTVNLPPIATAPPSRYTAADPLQLSDTGKIDILKTIDQHVRAKDARVHNVIANLSLAYKCVLIARNDGSWHTDIRPMTHLSVVAVLIDNGKVETGHAATGFRALADRLEPTKLSELAHEAVRIASVKLCAVDAPAGTMPVVLGNGWSGILLHEAVGHGLEGDFNRKGQSSFSGRIGERVAPHGVTVVDDGTIDDRRGSLTVDDEGTASRCNVLIDDGILCGYMQDVVNASLTNTAPTGNGRRQSFRHEPMPRMTNTYMRNGTYTPDEIIASVKRGLYCKSFSGGSVDITNGDFNFVVDEAYLIENGKLGPVVKGATVIGNGPVAMQNISMVANDFELDPGVGTCGKNGQWVPVGVGQPHCKVDTLLVGGADTGA